SEHRWLSKLTFVLHLTATEFYQNLAEFSGLGLCAPSRLPNDDAGHRGYQQSFGDCGGRLLLPLFDLMTGALKQLEVRLNDPAPVVPESNFTSWDSSDISQQQP